MESKLQNRASAYVYVSHAKREGGRVGGDRKMEETGNERDCKRSAKKLTTNLGM